MNIKSAPTIVAISLSVIILTEFIGIKWKETSLYESCQPKSIVYDSFNYCVVIIKVQNTISVDYELRVLDENKGTYFSVNYPNEGKYANFEEINTIWSAEGITIEPRQGEVLFFVSEKFTGGR